jgi:hypothetical protein
LAALQVCVQAMIVDQAAGDFQIDGAVPPLLGRTPGIAILLVRPDGPLVQTTGVTPLPVRTPPPAGTGCDQVMLSSQPFARGTIVWIVPFPYEELPMTTARWRSCSTAATISAADAETPSMRITNGRSAAISAPSAT